MKNHEERVRKFLHNYGVPLGDMDFVLANLEAHYRTPAYKELVKAMRDRLESRLPTTGSGVPRKLAAERKIIHRIVTEELDAALAKHRTPQADGWQAIETAPKDGTKFDAWTTAGRRLANVWWDKSSRSWFCELGPHEPYQLAEHLTHWRPLPAPPIPQESGHD